MGEISEFYSEQSNFISNMDIIKDMEKEYWKDIEEFLKTERSNPESATFIQDIITIAKDERDVRKLAYYVFYLKSMGTHTFDNRVQLSRLKEQLELNISAPKVEVIMWEYESYNIDFYSWKIRWTEREKKLIYEAEIAEMKEYWWYILTYKKWTTTHVLYITYEWRDKIRFYSEHNKESLIWVGNIQRKEVEVERWKYHRNWSYLETRTRENLLVEFSLRSKKLNFLFKFYDYD